MPESRGEQMEPSPSMATARGEWLRQRDWDHLAVLTFDGDATVDHAEREVKRWLRLVAQRAARRGMQWIYVVEQVVSGAPHVHVLTGGTAGLGVRDLLAAWRCGQAHVRRYDHRRGGAYYLVKTIGSEGAVYDLSAPPKHRYPSREQQPTPATSAAVRTGFR
jgi:hypothetical protein